MTHAYEPTAPQRTRFISITVLVALLLLCLGVGQWGAAVTLEPVRSWYPTLIKPAWTPPDWAFPVAWTILFVLMAVAAWLVWRAAPLARLRLAGAAFLLQLVLNGLWSYLFFGLRSPAYGLIEIAILWLAILATILLFRPFSKTAAWLLLPYLLWVSYATALNFEIWRLNG